jgi:hypothetical protein
MKKKSVIIIMSLLVLVGAAGTFWGSSIAEAATGIWNTCPKGKVNDPYPGQCNSYIDTNKDNICDRSQSAPVTSTASPTSTSESIMTTINTPAVPSDAGGTATTVSIDTGDSSQAAGQISVKRTSYGFIPILLVAAIFYALTWILSRKKVIRLQLHRKIWNLILLVSGSISALLGLFLTLNLEFNLNITLPVNMLFWHVEASIVMGIILVFHIVWHWKYFVKMVRMEPQPATEKKL